MHEKCEIKLAEYIDTTAYRVAANISRASRASADEVRRALAQISRAVLDLHRRDVPHGLAACPLRRAVVARVTRTPPSEVADSAEDTQR